MSDNSTDDPRPGEGSDPDRLEPPSNPPPTAGSTPPPAGGPYPPPPGGYPPPGGAPGNYPPPGNCPPPGNFPPQGSYPPPGPQGGYQPPGGYPPPPGNYPPQGGTPGGYPPPPGNYPPPPGNYGNYGNQGYGQTPLGPNPGRLDVGAALSYGFDKFKANVGPWLGLTAIVFVVGAVAFGVAFASTFAAAMDAGNRGETLDVGTFSIVSIVLTFVATFVGYFVNAVFLRGALDETGGAQKPTFGQFFRLTNVPQIAVLAVILTVVNVALGLIPFLGPVLQIVIGVLTAFTLTFVLDRNLPAVDAIKSSVDLVVKNFGPVILLILALAAINIIGAIPCGLGLLVTMPVSVIALTYAYRVLTGGPLSPAR